VCGSPASASDGFWEKLAEYDTRSSRIKNDLFIGNQLC
jgi:hypothetical protein